MVSGNATAPGDAGGGTALGEAAGPQATSNKNAPARQASRTRRCNAVPLSREGLWRFLGAGDLALVPPSPKSEVVVPARDLGLRTVGLGWGPIQLRDSAGLTPAS